MPPIPDTPAATCRATDSERFILGCMIVAPDDCAEAMAMLGTTGEPFFTRLHRELYLVLYRLITDREWMDPTVIVAEIRGTEWLGTADPFEVLVEMERAVLTPAALPAHVAYVLRAWRTRQLATRLHTSIEQLNTLADQVPEDAEIAASITTTTRHLAEIAELTTSADNGDHIRDVDTRFNARLQAREDAAVAGKDVVLVKTGICTIDNIVGGGWDPDGGEVVIIAARPSVGKTAFALQVAVHVAAHSGLGVGIFSMEMGEAQIYARMIARLTGIPYHDIIGGRARPSKTQRQLIDGARAYLHRLPIWIDDKGLVTPATMRATTIRWRNDARKRGVRLGAIVCDYLQLMAPETKTKDGNRNQEVTAISRSIKLLARELHITAIALSQLNREGGKGKPRLVDLRESGAIEQDADAVAFLHRPKDQDKSEAAEDIEFIVEKNRNGPCGTYPLRYTKAKFEFTSAATKGQEAQAR